mgnify:CR=1 FL=1
MIVVPTVDTVEEAKAGRDWTYFPPLGRRSNGGGQAFDAAMWGGVPGGYRNTINDNVVLIEMIETLEGIKNAKEIAKIPGVDALFAASGDLGNFSGYSQGSPDYERLINVVHDAALEAGKRLCGPLAWRDRPDFTCFQAGSETAAIADQHLFIRPGQDAGLLLGILHTLFEEGLARGSHLPVDGLDAVLRKYHLVHEIDRAGDDRHRLCGTRDRLSAPDRDAQRGGLAGQQHAIGTHLVGLGIDLHAWRISIVNHVFFLNTANVLDRR